MSIVYFIAPDGKSVIGLDCEESIGMQKKNKVTEYSVMTGETVSDGFQEGNKVVNLSGKVTYNKSVSQESDGTPNPIEIQDMLDDASRSHHRFRLYTDTDRLPLLKGIDECVVESYGVDLGGWTDTVTLSMTIKEVFVSDAAKKTYLPPLPNKEQAKSGSEPTAGKGGKTEVPEKEKATILRNLKDTGTYSGN